MQETSETYKKLIASFNHTFENKIIVQDVGEVAFSDVVSLNTNIKGISNESQIGKAISGEVDLEIIKPVTAIPQMAEIQPFFRAVGKIIQEGETAEIVDDVLVLSDAEISSEILVFGVNSGAYIKNDIICFSDVVYIDAESEWIPKGVFYVDTREESEHGAEKTIVIHGYDAMLRFEQDYPSTNHAWPYPDINVIEEMCQTVGVEVDPRTFQYITAGHMVNLPSGYSMREKLEQIAGIYCGNFVMSGEGKLLFVPLYGFEPELDGNYLADESGNALVFGDEGWCILV